MNYMIMNAIHEIANCSEYDNNGCITCDSTDYELYNHKCYS